MANAQSDSSHVVAPLLRLSWQLPALTLALLVIFLSQASHWTACLVWGLATIVFLMLWAVMRFGSGEGKALPWLLGKCMDQREQEVYRQVRGYWQYFKKNYLALLENEDKDRVRKLNRNYEGCRRYVPLGVLGEGVSKVYLALDCLTRSVVTVKWIGNKQMLGKKVEREIEALRKQNFYIADYYDEDQRARIIVSPCLPARSMYDEWDTLISCSAAVRIEILRQVLAQLRHLHTTLGLVHLDLSPKNILIQGRSFVAGTPPYATESVIARIIDFGLCKALNPKIGTSLSIPTEGHANFIPPPETITPAETVAYLRARDVWAWGLIAYHFLLGQSEEELRESETDLATEMSNTKSAIEQTAPKICDEESLYAGLNNILQVKRLPELLHGVSNVNGPYLQELLLRSLSPCHRFRPDTEELWAALHPEPSPAVTPAASPAPTWSDEEYHDFFLGLLQFICQIPGHGQMVQETDTGVGYLSFSECAIHKISYEEGTGRGSYLYGKEALAALCNARKTNLAMIHKEEKKVLPATSTCMMRQDDVMGFAMEVARQKDEAAKDSPLVEAIGTHSEEIHAQVTPPPVSNSPAIAGNPETPKEAEGVRTAVTSQAASGWAMLSSAVIFAALLGLLYVTSVPFQQVCHALLLFMNER